ncbi:MAG: metallophosphoesterase [Chloroflexota bacterium]
MCTDINPSARSLRHHISISILATSLIVLLIFSHSSVGGSAEGTTVRAEVLLAVHEQGRAVEHAIMSGSSNGPIRFAVIGDYGLANRDAEKVADLVKSWSPEFIATVGDNNYPSGEARYLDRNVGQFYHDFLFPYNGQYGSGSDTQRFFPVLGNHDWDSVYCSGSACSGPYFDYFNIAQDQRYYTFRKGPVRFFMLDSDSREPDGISGLSNQAMWLRTQLAQSDAVWNLVFLHHSPFSSGGHRSDERVQWPFRQWGTDVVFSGHNHVYERIIMDEMLYIVNGLGGKSRHHLRSDEPDWVQSSYNREYGAMLVDATNETITMQFINVDGVVIDSHTLTTEELDEEPLQSASSQQAISIPILYSDQDAVEWLSNGAVEQSGHILHLGESEQNQATLIGLRFTNVPIPQGAIVLSASLGFTNQRKEIHSATLHIAGEKSCSAESFDQTPHILSYRDKTSSVVTWGELEEWKYVGESKNTADISPIVQEIVNEQGWEAGNAMAFYLWGSGSRKAVAYELQPQAATHLNITYELALNAEITTEPDTESESQSEGQSEEQTGPLPPNGLYIPLLVHDLCPTN